MFVIYRTHSKSKYCLWIVPLQTSHNNRCHYENSCMYLYIFRLFTIWNSVCHLFLEYKIYETKWNSYQICKVYGENTTSDKIVWKWVRHFSDKREYIHDNVQNRWSLVNDDLVCAADLQICEGRPFTISSCFCFFYTGLFCLKKWSIICFRKLCSHKVWGGSWLLQPQLVIK